MFTLLPSGKLADVNVWSRELSVEEMISFTSCKTVGNGDWVNWETAQWFNTNVTNIKMCPLL